jgi:TrmH family RNA methyltransferase
LLIESTHNQYVKRLRALATRKGRREHGEFLVEGVRSLEEAAEAGADISYLAHCPELADAPRARELAEHFGAAGDRVMEVTEQVFRSFSQVQSPEGLAAAVAIPATGLTDLRADAGLWLAAADVRDPGNLGTLVRTADAVGADGLIAAGTCADLYEPKVVRASAGSIFHLPLVQSVAPKMMLEWAAEGEVAMVATTLEDATRYTDIEYPERVLLMFGGEARGLDAELVAAADFRVFIPMPGRADSLNVGVAGGVLAWEVLRQRQ